MHKIKSSKINADFRWVQLLTEGHIINDTKQQKCEEVKQKVVNSHVLNYGSDLKCNTSSEYMSSPMLP